MFLCSFHNKKKHNKRLNHTFKLNTYQLYKVRKSFIGHANFSGFALNFQMNNVPLIKFITEKINNFSNNFRQKLNVHRKFDNIIKTFLVTI